MVATVRCGNRCKSGPFRALFFALVLALAGLTACVSTNVTGPVTEEPATSGYGIFTLIWQGTFEGSRTELFFKRFEKDGKLAICGYYERSSGQAERLQFAWLNGARIVINDQDIVSTRFLKPWERGTPPVANCVTTTIPFSEDLVTGTFALKGNDIHIYD